MISKRPLAFRLARGFALCVLGLAAFYLVAANAVLATGLVRSLANSHPDEVGLEYRSAYTFYPGHIRVQGLKLRYQDRSIQFELFIDDARVRWNPSELLERRFHATRVRTTGTSWRMIHNVEAIAGQEQRVASFPLIFDGPPILKPEAEGPPTGYREGQWTVHLDDVEAEISELWFLEYRFLGKGKAMGSFEITPNKSIWVGPALLTLEPGTLSAGTQLISSHFSLTGDVTIDPFDVISTPGIKVLRSITGSVKLDVPISDVGAVELYVPGLKASGKGTLVADFGLVEGRISAASRLDARLSQLKVRQEDGTGFNGNLNTTFKVTADEKGKEWPMVRAVVAGSALVPISKEATVTAALSGASCDLALSTTDFVEGLGLAWLTAQLDEARVEDARAINEAAGKKAPFIVPAILGNGPLVASGSATMTPGKLVVRLKEASLGGAAVAGASQKTGETWNGAAAGHMGVVPLGLKLKGGAMQIVPFTDRGWLDAELQKFGITLEAPKG